MHLAVDALSADLPAELEYWRSVGRVVVERVCGALDPLAPEVVVLGEPDPEVLARWVRAVPPMVGAELVTEEGLAQIWRDVGEALAAAAKAHAGGLQGYLEARGSVWNVVGRVCLHLAENKRDPEYPFAFMATYVHKVSEGARPQHVPLGQALREYAGAKNKARLIALLAPLSRAADSSAFVRALVERKDIYHPLAWTPEQAYRFLREVPSLERSGLVVRLPDWWSARSARRPRVSATVGGAAPARLGMDALLDFDVRVTLDGEPLEGAALEQLLSASAGLVLIKGQWVEVESDKLSRLLAEWHAVQAQAAAGGLRFAEAMRLLAGVSGPQEAGEGDDGARPQWAEVVAERWLSDTLEGLRAPERLAERRAQVEANAGLSAELRPYQKDGVRWLSSLRDLGLGGCLADDMGLGKTIQVLARISPARGRTVLLEVRDGSRWTEVDRGTLPAVLRQLRASLLDPE